MFAFPDYGNPFMQQRPRSQQPSHSRRSVPVRRDPFSAFFPDSYYSDQYSGPYEARAREAQRKKLLEQEARRQRAMEEEVARRRALQQEKMRRQQEAQSKRQQKLRLYNDAATTIQRAWRQYRRRQNVERQNQAALIITDFLRRLAAYKSTHKVVESLRKLKSSRQQLRQLLSDFHASPFGYRHLLWFNDTLEKFIIGLDGIEVHGSSFVRSVRRSLVKEAQRGLTFSDVVLKTMNRKAAVIQRWTHRVLNTKHYEQQNHAAHVITRAFRAFPAVVRARQVRSSLKQLSEFENQVETQRQQLFQSLQQLEHLSSSLATEMDGSTLSLQLKREAADAHDMLNSISRPLKSPKRSESDSPSHTYVEQMDIDDEEEAEGHVTASMDVEHPTIKDDRMASAEGADGHEPAFYDAIDASPSSAAPHPSGNQKAADGQHEQDTAKSGKRKNRRRNKKKRHQSRA